MATLSALPHECVILDACCAITLFESGYMGAILAATGKQSAISSYVLEEEVKHADLWPFIDAGQLLVVSPENESEEITLVNFAVELDDGEAVTGAIAAHRNWAIATDDTKATNFFAKAAPQLARISTPDLIKNWVEGASPLRSEVRAALGAIRAKARYEPSPKHPLHEWWQSQLS